MLNKKWLLVALCSLACTAMAGCADDSSDPVDEPEQPVVTADPTMTVAPASVKMKTGVEQKLVVLYKDGEGKSKGSVALQAASSDATCVEIKAGNEMVSTLDSGMANIMIVSKDKECSADVTISDISGADKAAKSVKVPVVVSKDAPAPVDPVGDLSGELMIVSPDGTISFEASGKNTDIVLMYVDANGATNAGVSVVANSDNPECVGFAASSASTDENGKVTFTAAAVADKCSAGLTFSVKNDDKATASIAAEVGEVPDYRVTLKFNYMNHGSDDDSVVGARIANVNKIVFGNSATGSCPSDDKFLADTKVSFFKEKKEINSSSLNTFSNPVYTYPNFVLEKANSDTMIAYALDSNDTVLAYGCSKTVTKADAGSAVFIPMNEIGLKLAKGYNVVSNFDLTSGFERSKDGTGFVEKMSAGDWVQFFLDFCEDPVGTLVDFIWVNSLSRLKLIKTDDMDNETIKAVVDFLITLVDNDATKNMAIGMLEPMIEGYIKGYGWYNAIRTIAPDVSDLTSNMQLVGTFKMGEFEDLKVSGVKEEYTQLQYQWSYNVTDNTPCILEKDGYIKNKVCRRAMLLGSGSNITGNWSGNIDDTIATTYDGLINIDSHNLQFKWVTILYNAVMSEILPNALGYAGTDSVKSGLFIKAFLEKLLFEQIVKYYKGYTNEDYVVDEAGNIVTNPDGSPKKQTVTHGGCEGHYDCDPKTSLEEEEAQLRNEGKLDGAKKYPTLTIDDPAKSCERFIEVLVRLIYKGDNSVVNTGINIAAPFVCGEKAIGQLDTLVKNALANLDKTADNRFMLSTDSGCQLHAEGNEYVSMGTPDIGFYSANEVFSENKASTRCKWDVKFNMGSADGTGETKTFNIKGLFHATKDDLL